MEAQLQRTQLVIENNRDIEIFAKPGPSETVEFWWATEIEGTRTLINHNVVLAPARDEIFYAIPGDLVWTDTDTSKIPATKSDSAVRAEEDIETDPEYVLPLEFACELLDLELKTDRKTWNQAKKDLYGTWSDGAALLTINEDDSVQIECPDDNSHPLYHFKHLINADVMTYCKNWQLGIANSESSQGLTMYVIRCNASELHVAVEDPLRIAHIFVREQS